MTGSTSNSGLALTVPGQPGAEDEGVVIYLVGNDVATPGRRASTGRHSGCSEDCRSAINRLAASHPRLAPVKIKPLSLDIPAHRVNPPVC